MEFPGQGSDPTAVVIYAAAGTMPDLLTRCAGARAAEMPPIPLCHSRNNKMRLRFLFFVFVFVCDNLFTYNYSGGFFCFVFCFFFLFVIISSHTIILVFFCFVLFFVFLPFLGLLPWHMEVPRLGV